MTIIYKNESCKVEKVKNQKYKITIFTEEKYPKFWKTVKTNLEKDSNKKSFLFDAKEVLLLNTLLKRSDHSLSYLFCKSIFLNIGKQKRFDVFSTDDGKLINKDNFITLIKENYPKYKNKLVVVFLILFAAGLFLIK